MSPRSSAKEQPAADQKETERAKVPVNFEVLCPVIIQGTIFDIHDDAMLVMKLARSRRGKNQFVYPDISEAALKLHMGSEKKILGGGAVRQALLVLHREAYAEVLRERDVHALNSHFPISNIYMEVRGDTASMLEQAVTMEIFPRWVVRKPAIITANVDDGHMSFSLPKNMPDYQREKMRIGEPIVLHGQHVHLGPMPRKRRAS